MNMNTKYFSLGFTAMDSVITGVSAAKRSVVNVAKSPVHSVKTGVLNTSEVVTSFIAGAKQAIEYRKQLEDIGKRRMLTVDVLSNEDGS